MSKPATQPQSEVKAHYSLNIVFRIVSAMDRINHREHPYDKKLYDKIERIIILLQARKFQFTFALMEALAEGNPKHPLLVQFRLHYPKPYRELTDLLDELYTTRLPT